MTSRSGRLISRRAKISRWKTALHFKFAAQINLTACDLFSFRVRRILAGGRSRREHDVGAFVWILLSPVSARIILFRTVFQLDKTAGSPLRAHLLPKRQLTPHIPFKNQTSHRLQLRRLWTLLCASREETSLTAQKRTMRGAVFARNEQSEAPERDTPRHRLSHSDVWTVENRCRQHAWRPSSHTSQSNVSPLSFVNPFSLHVSVLPTLAKIHHAYNYTLM